MEEQIVKIENASKLEDVLDTRTPEQIERELVEKEEREVLEQLASRPPEEIAAQFFHMIYPLFKERVNGLMAKDAKKVIDALIAFPIEMDEPDFRNESSLNVFNLGTRLLEAKFIMQQSVEMDRRIQAEKTHNEAVQNVLNTVETNFEQGEQVNG